VGVALVVLLPVATFARDHRWRDHHAILTQPGEGAVNTVAAGTSFVAELQWPAARLPQALNQFLQRRGGVGECAIRRGLADVPRGGNRNNDRILVYVDADESCKLFHDPSPVPEAPRQTIRRDPRSLHMARRVTPSGRPRVIGGSELRPMPQIPTGWFQGLRPWRVQARALALLSFPGSPGPETDMRSSAPAHPRPVSPKRTPAGTPSRPGEFHPEPLTDPDLTLSRHPARATETKAAAFRQKLELILSPVGSLSASVTCPLCSTGITPLHHYYGAVRPWPAHRYFGLAVSAACALSLGIVGQVLKFHAKARMKVTPPAHRTPYGQ